MLRQLAHKCEYCSINKFLRISKLTPVGIIKVNIRELHKWNILPIFVQKLADLGKTLFLKKTCNTSFIIYVVCCNYSNTIL